MLGDRTTGAPFPGDRRGCLLAYLANDGGWVDRDRLAWLFWPDADETAAKRNLRQLLLRVKRLPLDPPLEATPEALRWPIACDVGDFRQAVAGGDTGHAVALYQGSFMDGFAAHDVGGIDTWLESERDRLHAAFHGACMREVAVATAGGRFDHASDLLTRLFELDPLAEDVVAALVRTLYLGGRRDAAIAVYERFENALEEELGLRPLQETTVLIDLVRRGNAVTAPAPAEPPREKSHDHLLQPSRLVAREAEVQALRAAATAAIVVAGEPGVGKSALLRQALPDALRCGASEGLERLPYHPLAALVRQRPDLTAGLGPYREDLARLVPEVAPDLTPGPLDPTAAKGRLAEALARLVEAGGNVLSVDDLQWADPATLETLLYFADRGVRVYGAYRTGEASPRLLQTLDALRSRRLLTELNLEPIPEQGIRALIGHLMGRTEGPPTFARQMWSRSGGNPLFLMESLRSLFEAGVLTADERGWHTAVDEITLDYSELDVPHAVSQVIARRLGRLKGRTVRVLEALAVGRSEPDARLLSRVTGLSPGAVADALDEAAATGFLRQSAFRHDLLRQSLEERIEPARKRHLHRLMAEALAATSHHGMVAEHWWQAGEPGNARAAWLRQTAAMRAGGLQVDALAVLSEALSRLPDGVDADWIRLAMSDASRESHSVQEAQALVTQVLAADREDPTLRFRAILTQAWLHFYRGSVEDGEAALAQAQGLAAVCESEDLQFEHVLLRAQAAKERLNAAEALALMEPAVARLRRRKPDLRLVQFLSSLAGLYDDTGRPAEALPLHLEALALARAIGSRYFQVEVCINLLFCYADLGRHEEAIAKAEDALSLGDYDNVPVLRTNLAANYFQAARYQEALGHYRLLSESSNRVHLRLIALARTAECLAELGDLDEVPRLLDEVLAMVPQTDFRVAWGAAAISLYRFGDDRQVMELERLLPELSPEQLPLHQRRRLESAMATRR